MGLKLGGGGGGPGGLVGTFNRTTVGLKRRRLGAGVRVHVALLIAPQWD